MEATGERFIPSVMDWPLVAHEHWHRYYFASQYIKDKIVLDIACGSGYGTNFLADHAKEITGIDIAEESVVYAQKNFPHERITFKQGSIANIPLPDKSIDVIISFETIEHVDEQIQTQAMQEFKRVLKDNGILIISTPNVNSPEHNPDNEYHFKEFHTDEFVEFLKSHFEFVTYGGQDIRFASTIYDSENCEAKIHFSNYPELGKAVLPPKSAAKYIIAICSNKEEIPIHNSALVNNETKMPADQSSEVAELRNTCNKLLTAMDEDTKYFQEQFRLYEQVITQLQEKVSYYEKIINQQD